MKNKYFVFVLLVGLALVSCKRESFIPAEETPEYVTINATLDAGNATKTYLDGVQVKWEAGDQFQLWYGTLGTAMKGASYVVKTIDALDARQATFNGLGLASDDYMGVYPLSASVDCSKKGKLTVALPTAQTGVAGSFGSGANVAVAYSSTTTLGFQNVGGLLAFKISDDGGHAVKTVRLSGTEALSGEVEIKQATLPAVDAVTAGVNYLTLSIPASSTLRLDGSNEGFGTDGGSWAGEDPEPGSDPVPAPGGGGGTSDDLFYFVALPGSHTAFTLTLIDEAGNTAVASSSHAFEIERNSNTLIADLTVPSAKWHADATVYINEVSTTQIELYNPGGAAVDLSGWVLQSGGSSWAFLPGTSIAAGAFLTVTAGQASCTTGPMFTIGGSVSLVNGGTVDSIELGIFSAGESYGRTTDGGGEWAVYSTPSLGETNANGVVKTVDTDVIVLNEVNGNGTKFIELYNAGETTVSLTGWKLYKDEGLVWTGAAELSLAAGNYLVLYSAKNDSNPVGAITFKGGLSAGKSVKVDLYNASEVLKDSFVRGEKGAKWGDITLPVNASATFSRVPNGTGAWKYAAPTPGAENGEKTGTIEQYPAANGVVRLNEINGNDKFIELYSTATDQKISLEDVTIQKDGKLVWTGQPGCAIEPGGYVLLYSEDVIASHPEHDPLLVFSSGLSAKNAVRVQLFNPAGGSIDDFNLSTKPASAAPASYGRNSDGVWYYQDATPGAANSDGATPVTGLE